MCNLDAVFGNFPQLETERLILRNIRREDYLAIFDVYRDYEAVKYQNIFPMYNVEQAWEYVDFLVNSYARRRFIRWAIVKKEEDILIGFVTLHDFNRENSKAQIGYMLNRICWRQNIMTEAALKVIEFAFNEVGLNKVEAHIHPQNAASIALTEKLQFKRESYDRMCTLSRITGEYEDRLVYGLYKKDYV